MSKHTPGPWAVTLMPAGKAKVVDSHGFIIANVTGGPYAQGHIDARLMAAAPDLLAAAQYAVAMEDEPRFLYEAIRDLRAAIAKATGEGA